MITETNQASILKQACHLLEFPQAFLLFPEVHFSSLLVTLLLVIHSSDSCCFQLNIVTAILTLSSDDVHI